MKNINFRILTYYVVFTIVLAIITAALQSIFLSPNNLSLYKYFDLLLLVLIAAILIFYFVIYQELKKQQGIEIELDKLARVVQQSADHVLITDKNGMIEYVNPAFEKLTGYSAKEVSGLTPRILKSGKMSSDFYKHLWETILAGKVFQAELINRKKDGTIYYEEKTITPIRDAGGNITNFVSTAKDSTERKMAEETMKRADKMKTEFMQMISHEFRTPLTAIKGFASLLDGETYGQLSPAQKDFIYRISSQATHLEDLIISILDFTRLEFGKRFEVKKEPISIATIINDVVEVMRMEFQKKEITINVDIAAGLPTIISDEAKIERILTNILGNAFKFTPRRGVVTISAQPLDGKIKISVTDTGIGIAKDNLNKIFDRFYQVDSSITRGYGGIGMGLAIAREMVEALGGEIQAVSEGEGKGTTIEFTLPVS